MRTSLLRASLAALSCSFCAIAADIDRIRELNALILADSSGKSARRSAASDSLLRERAALLRTALAEDPAAARTLLLRPETLRDLRSLAGADTSIIERPFAYTGPVEVKVLDSPSERRSVQSYAFEVGGESLAAHGGPALALQCGDHARLEGYRLGDAMLVTASAVERHADAPAECRTDGVQRVAIILANFPGRPVPEITKARVGDIAFGASGRSAATFYKEASYGQLSLTGDVFGWYTLDRAYGCGEFFGLRAAALAAADRDIDFTRYSRVVVITPGLVGCSITGEGTIGCQTLFSPSKRFRASYASVRFDRPEDLLFTLIHELGHNLGVRHARTMRFPGIALGADRGLATFEEYGDRFSVMGSGEAHFSAAQKAKLGWIRPPVDYVQVQSAGVFDLLPLQSAASGVKALRVKRNSGEDVLWIEYRQPVGTFDASVPESQRRMFEGALIRAQIPAEELNSDLLDFTPAGIDEARLQLLPGLFDDPVLRVGQIWRDPYSDLTLEVQAATPERLRIAVRYETSCASVSGLSEGTAISPEGRPLAFSVAAGGDCSWSAVASRTWLDVPSGLNRKGSGTLTLEAQRNPSATPRSATITVERKTFGVTQSGPPARPAISSFGPKQGNFPHLRWIATETILSDPNGVSDLKELFILINDTQNEQNACMVRYDFAEQKLALKVPSTTGYSLDTIRNGEFRFADNSRCGAGYPTVVAISDTEILAWIEFAFLPAVSRPQEIHTMAVDRSGATTGWIRQGDFTFGTACRVVPRPFRRDIPAAADVHLLEVVPTSEPCRWQASSGTPWITVATPGGNGNDLVFYTVEANPGPGPRTGAITVGDYTVQVVQAAPGALRLSDFIVSPAEALVSSGRGVMSISVRSQNGSDWKITNAVPWLTVAEKSEDWVTLVHEENTTGSERRATLTVAGHTVVVRQAAGDPLRPAVAVDGVVNAASFLAGISSGAWFTVRGVNLAPTTRTWTAADFNGDRLPTSLDGVRVLINGKPAYVYYISPTQINALAPEDTVLGETPIEVENNGRRSLFNVAFRRTRAPGLFMLPAPAARLAAATLPDGVLVAPSDTFVGAATRGAKPGEAVSFYATGLGQTTISYPEGRLIEQPLPIAAPVVTIGGRAARVLYAGLISPGLYQINIEVPELAAGEHEIVLTAQGTRTMQKAMLAVAP